MDIPLFTTIGQMVVPKRSKFWKVLQASRSILKAYVIKIGHLLPTVWDGQLGCYVIKKD